MSRLSRSLCLALATTALTVATPALAKHHESAKPAAVADLVAAVAIPYDEFTLDNGLKVLVHTDRKAPIVGVAMWYNVGSKDEPKGKTGFAHLFEHLMFNGSENAPGDYFEYLQEMGATDYNGTTNFDRTNYFQTVPRGALERALFIESDRMGYLLGAITQKKLDNQRGVVQNEKRQGDNQPGGLVFYEILKNIFPEGHPYHHTVIGSMADLDAATMDDVRDWFRNKYGPNNATLVLAGDISVTEARPLVEKYFGQIARGPVNVPAAASIPQLEQPLRTVMQDQVAATNISHYWPAPGISDRALTALSVGADILGGLSSSRLDNALVRDEKIAVSVSAGNYAFQRVGILSVGATVKPGADVALVEKRMNEIVEKFIAEGPTEDEVRRAATDSIASTIRGLEQVGGFGGKAVTLAHGQVLAGDPGFYEKQLEILATLTPAEVKAAMQQWLTRPDYSITLEPGERTGEYAEAAGEPVADKAETGDDTITVSVKRDPPPISNLAPLDFPDVTHISLSNGMKVHYAMRAAVPVTRIALSFNAGSAADPVAKRGLETLALTLFEEGTASLTSREIAEAQERLGSQLSLAGGADRSNFEMTALTPNLEPSLDLLAEIVRNPAFAPAEIERVRTQQITSIEQQMRTPQSMASTTLAPLLYGEDHPYGATGSGTVESVKSITRADLTGFQTDWIRPDNGEIFVVSDMALNRLKPILEARFGNWRAPTTAKGEKSFAAASVKPDLARIVVVNRPNSPQSYIYGGLLTPLRAQDADIVDLSNANNALGGNFLARFNMNLRETKGWSYGVRGAVRLTENAVAYTVAAPVQADRTGDSLRELITELNAFLGDKGVTDAELKRVIVKETRELPGQFETSDAVLSAMESNALYGRPDNYYETLADRYAAQTRESLDTAARRALATDQFTWVIVGDAEKIRPQLDGLDMPIEYRGYEASDTAVNSDSSSDDSADNDE